MMLKLMFNLVSFLVQWLVFYFHLGESILLLALIYYLLRQVLYSLPQLWPVHKWILWTVYHLGLTISIFFSLSKCFKVCFKTHCKFNEYGYFMGVIYHDNVGNLGCNTNVCGYCRDTTSVVVTRQVGMNDPVCLFT